MTTRRTALQTAALFTATLALVGAPSAEAASGGPDAYGYTWADSNSGGPAFNYELASTAASLTAEDSMLVTLPFTFTFDGIPYTQARIQSNGVLTFDLSGDLDSWNQCLQFASFTGLAPWWDDLDPSAGTIYYGSTGTTGNRIFIVEWYGIEHDAVGGNITFEIKLFEADNHIEFHYEDVTTDSATYTGGNSGSVGITDWGLGTSVVCNANQLADEYAIGFYPPTGGGCADFDGDGYEDASCGGTDCDDLDAATYPGAFELCDFGDNDCDGLVDEGWDADTDGWTTCNGDCDDGNGLTNPNANEVCDFVDNDCDSIVDEGFDNDVDGYTTCDGDCDDTEPTANPGQWEDTSTACFDGIDNDCDGDWDLDDQDCSDWVGDDDDATGDDDDATGDDDDATGDDDDATGDDDDATGDDDDDDDATGDDDDSAGDDDDDDDDGGNGGRGGGGSRGGRACSQGDTTPGGPFVTLLFTVLTGLALRRRT